MQNNQLETFTNRGEAIALFEYLCKNDPNKPWPLLPILTFIAPGGRGKSTLIEYLRASKCCLPDGQPMLPYAYLDFTQVETPRDLLSILVALRNQLQAHEDGQGRHLTFPYFDLGAAIALATPRDGDLPFFIDIQRRLIGAWPYFESLNERGFALGNIIPIIPPLLAGLKFGVQIPALQDLLHHLEYSSGWHWYRLHGNEMGLTADASVSDVLLRLHALSRTGKADKPGRDYLVQHVLPAALLADLRDSLDGPSVWNETTHVVLFLDGFDTLLSSSETGNTGLRLLEMFALGEHRKRGEADPLLLVISCRGQMYPDLDSPPYRAPGIPSVGASVELAERVSNPSRPSPMYRPSSPSPNISSALYQRWQQQLPNDKQMLRLKDLYLPLELQNFKLEDTANYLLKLAKCASISHKQQVSSLTLNGLAQTMHRFTRGHPLYLALAAACVLEAEAHGKTLDPGDFTGFEDDSPSTVGNIGAQFTAPSDLIALGYEDISIAEYLCSLYLHQLSGQEEDRLIFCALPRTLDIETLQVTLQLPNNNDIQHHWNRCRNLPFVRVLDSERIVIHPILRRLFLQRLPPEASPTSNYHRIHMRLREHFHHRAAILSSVQSSSVAAQSVRMRGNEYARIEEAYHALALGDPDPAISVALFAQRARFALWEPLLDAIVQAPTALMPAHTSQQAAGALASAMQHHRTQDIVVAIVLFTWLLTDSQENKQKAAEIQNNLGAAYWTLASGDRQANLEKAITCYHAALQVYTRDTFPIDWATAQNNLGAAYWTLASTDRQDRQANLEKAIACSKAALQVYTRTAFPADWARTQFNLGHAYNDVQDEKREENLEKAIACYESALQIYTRNDFPIVWAKTYDSLGNAYASLSGDKRQANLRRAIECYKAALEIYTHQKFPVAWAKVQHRLGDAYRDLLDEDPQQANLKQAIALYQSALQVYTRDSFPTDWAEAQDSLGYTYASLLNTDSQNRRTYLQKAIECYESALQVYTRHTFPSNWASTQNNLGYAYAFLSEINPANRQENLKKAIACYKGALQVFSSLQFDDYIQLVTTNLVEAQEQLLNNP